MSKNKKRIILFFSILVGLILIISSVWFVVETEHRNNVRRQIDQYVKMQQYKQDSNVSWANGAILGNINKEKVNSIEFTDSYDSVSSKSWLFDGIRCHYKDGKVSIVVGKNLKVNGSMKKAFADLPNLVSIDGLGNLDTKNVKNMSFMFQNCKSLESINAEQIKMDNVETAEGMFYGCEKIKSLDMSDCNLENAINLNRMFYNCKSISSLKLPKTKNVETMVSMLENVGQLSDNYANVQGIMKTPVLRDVTNMCKNTSIFNYEFLEKINTENLETSYGILEGSSIETIDLSNWKTNKLISVERMFAICSNLTYANMYGWNVIELDNASNMFYYCTSLKSVVLDWNVSHGIKNLNSMFKNCSSLPSIDLTFLNGHRHGDAREILMDCDSLVDVKGLNFESEANDRMIENATKINYKKEG